MGPWAPTAHLLLSVQQEAPEPVGHLVGRRRRPHRAPVHPRRHAVVPGRRIGHLEGVGAAGDGDAGRPAVVLAGGRVAVEQQVGDVRPHGALRPRHE